MQGKATRRKIAASVAAVVGSIVLCAGAVHADGDDDVRARHITTGPNEFSTLFMKSGVVRETHEDAYWKELINKIPVVSASNYGGLGAPSMYRVVRDKTNYVEGRSP